MGVTLLPCSPPQGSFARDLEPGDGVTQDSAKLSPELTLS